MRKLRTNLAARLAAHGELGKVPARSSGCKSRGTPSDKLTWPQGCVAVLACLLGVTATAPAQSNFPERAFTDPTDQNDVGEVMPFDPASLVEPGEDEVGDALDGLIQRVAPRPAVPEQPREDPPPTTAILHRARMQTDVSQLRSVYLACTLVLIQPPAAFDGSAKTVLGAEQSMLRAERHLAWDGRRLASLVRSPAADVWVQWLGSEGYAEQISLTPGDRRPLRSRDLRRLVSWPLNPFGRDLCLTAWWLESSRQDVQTWRDESAYRVLGSADYLGELCTVLAFDDGKERGEEWYTQTTGRLRRLRVYHRNTPPLPAAGDPDEVVAADNQAVRRDRIFQAYQEIAPGVWLPRQSVESVRSSETGDIMSVLHMEMTEVTANEPTPNWMFDPQRNGPSSE